MSKSLEKCSGSDCRTCLLGEPGVSGDPQVVAGPSAASSSDQHNVAFIGSSGDQQFEDASSPEKQHENSQRSGKFSLRSLPKKRYHQDQADSDDPDSPHAQRRPGSGFAL